MIDLTERQIAILKAIIEEYIETAQAVGSETLERKYNLGVSPATIRNEMVKLTEKGLLRQAHTSAGRTPTPAALRFYIKQLMKMRELSVADEIAVKEKVWDYRQEFDKLLRETAYILSEKTRTLALATDEEGNFYYAGAANILDMPEFYDIDLTKALLSLLDRFSFWEELEERLLKEDEPVHFLLGEEIGEKILEPCGFVCTHYQVPKHRGILGVVGPYRLNYSYIIPVIRYFGELIEEIGQNW